MTVAAELQCLAPASIPATDTAGQFTPKSYGVTYIKRLSAGIYTLTVDPVVDVGKLDVTATGWHDAGFDTFMYAVKYLSATQFRVCFVAVSFGSPATITAADPGTFIITARLWTAD